MAVSTLTWERLVDLEPRLQTLYDECLAAPYIDDWTSDRLWYLGFKKRMSALVGWDAGIAPELWQGKTGMIDLGDIDFDAARERHAGFEILRNRVPDELRSSEAYLVAYRKLEAALYKNDRDETPQ